ncbi:CLUMA_CG013013, isoform A, partial [Clunio marinus]
MEKLNMNLNIQQLPEEIIEKILSFLNLESLKAAALTCKTLNEISSQMRWELKLEFDNEIEEEPWVDVLLTSNRNFISIRCDGYIDKQNIRLMNFFENHGCKIQKLVIEGGKFHDSKIFCDILSTMPKLKEISFYNSNTKGRFADNISEDHLPHLPKLETLKLDESDFELMKYFKETQINSLEIVNHNTELEMKILLDFLTNQKNLKCLNLVSISGIFFSEFFKTSIPAENIPFKLKELLLSDINKIETFNHYNLLKFLEFHSDTVEKLGLIGLLADFVFEFIFAKFKRLVSLTFFNRALPCDLPLYKRLEINRNIKILNIPHLHLIEIKEDALTEFFKHVPNVEKLRTSTMMSLDIVLNALTRLKHLELYGLSPTLRQIKSQSLQSITIDCLAFIHDWEKFATDNPKVDTMKIRIIDETFDIVELLTNMKLQHLDLPVIKVDDNVCKTLRENTQDMQSLRIHKASFENCQENLSDIKCLRFHDESGNDDEDKI